MEPIKYAVTITLAGRAWAHEVWAVRTPTEMLSRAYERTVSDERIRDIQWRPAGSSAVVTH